MTADEALAKAKSTYGHLGTAYVGFAAGYSVGVFPPAGGVTVLGRGASWEEAFANAELNAPKEAPHA